MNRSNGIRARVAASKPALCLLAMACCVHPADADDKAHALKIDDEALRLRWLSAMEQLHVPGMSVVVVQPERVVFLDGFGVADLDSRTPVTGDTAFYIASSTKSFTAAGVMALVAEGKIDLDAPVRSYLPRFSLPDEALASKLCVRDLLCHHYGIDQTAISFAEAFSGQIDDDKFYRLLPASRIRGRFGYSNLHFTIAGRIIESVTGNSWKQSLKRSLFVPIGMTRTTCSATELYGWQGVALPYEFDGEALEPVTTRKTDRTMHAAGGMGTSAADLGRWLRMNLGGGVIDGKVVLPKPLVAEMQKQQTPVGLQFYEFSRDGYGLGWYVGKYNDRRFVHHFGGFDGYRAHVSFMPDDGIGVAVLINATGPGFNLPDLVACDIYDRLLGDDGPDKLIAILERGQGEQARRPPRRPAPSATRGLSLPVGAYVGSYEDAEWGRIDVSTAGDKLTAQLGALPLAFSTIGEDRFYTYVLPRQRFIGGFDVREGAVEAISLRWNDRDMRFVRVGQ